MADRRRSLVRSAGARTNSPKYQSVRDGGAEGVRTPDLLNAIQALYQLSYDPNRSSRKCKSRSEIVKIILSDDKSFCLA